MAKKRMFISFDADHDEFLRIALAGQAKHDDSPFDFADHSNKDRLAGDWKAKTRTKIKGCDLVAIVCGENTHTASGVSEELKMAQEEGVPYFLLKGYADKNCTWPKGVLGTDKMYQWTWPNLKALVGGGR